MIRDVFSIRGRAVAAAPPSKVARPPWDGGDPSLTVGALKTGSRTGMRR